MYRLAVWAQGEPLTTERAKEIYGRLGETNSPASLAPSASLRNFKAELEEEIPGLSFTAASAHVLFDLKEEDADGLAFDLAELADRHGLICFDPQRSEILSGPMVMDAFPPPPRSRGRGWWKRLAVMIGVGGACLATALGAAWLSVTAWTAGGEAERLGLVGIRTMVEILSQHSEGRRHRVTVRRADDPEGRSFDLVVYKNELARLGTGSRHPYTYEVSAPQSGAIEAFRRRREENRWKHTVLFAAGALGGLGLGLWIAAKMRREQRLLIHGLERVASITDRFLVLEAGGRVVRIKAPPRPEDLVLTGDGVLALVAPTGSSWMFPTPWEVDGVVTIPAVFPPAWKMIASGAFLVLLLGGIAVYAGMGRQEAVRLRTEGRRTLCMVISKSEGTFRHPLRVKRVDDLSGAVFEIRLPRRQWSDLEPGMTLDYVYLPSAPTEGWLSSERDAAENPGLMIFFGVAALGSAGMTVRGLLRRRAAA